jgi:hypothetical protein
MNKDAAETIDKIAMLPKSQVRLKYPKDSKLSRNQKRTIRKVFNKCRINDAIDECISDALAYGGRFW